MPKWKAAAKEEPPINTPVQIRGMFGPTVAYLDADHQWRDAKGKKEIEPGLWAELPKQERK